jgi:hypothetical protein
MREDAFSVPGASRVTLTVEIAGQSAVTYELKPPESGDPMKIALEANIEDPPPLELLPSVLITPSSFIKGFRLVIENIKSFDWRRDSQPHSPRRGSDVEAWLKDRRVEYIYWNGASGERRGVEWGVVDRLLDDYRLRADTRLALDADISEAGL